MKKKNSTLVVLGSILLVEIVIILGVVIASLIYIGG